MSQHLKVLKLSGLVFDRAEGTRRIYRVDPTGVAAMPSTWTGRGTPAWPSSPRRPRTRSANREDKTDDAARRVGGGPQTIIVEASQQTAFEVFTAKLGTWWPREYSIGEADMADFVLEAKAAGRWYEVGVDGKECDTGRVLAFDPPERLVIAWHLNEAWQARP